MTATKGNGEKEFKRERKEEDTAKNSDFPCPICGSSGTVSYIPQDIIHAKRLDKSLEFPVVHATNGMPNYLRHRRCTECEAKWQTVESVIMDTVKNRQGQVVN